MLYCKRCKLLSNDGVCLKCATKKLVEPCEDDLVYIDTKDVRWSAIIEDILKENNIECVKQSLLGAFGLETGRIEEYDFFVPFKDYDKAQELIKITFSE